MPFIGSVAELAAGSLVDADFVLVLDASNNSEAAKVAWSGFKALFDLAGMAAAAVAVHVASGDPHTQYLTEAAAASTYQPLDADLTAIAALTGTNTIYYRSASNTWTPVTMGSGLSFSSGSLTATGSGGGTDLEWVNVKTDHGAVGNGIADDTVAIQAAIADALLSSGVVYFPPGTYNYTHLDCTVGVNACLTLRGCQGYQWWGPDTQAEGRTILHCTATDALEGIYAYTQQGFIVQDIQFSYVSGYTGTLLAIGKDQGGANGTNTVIVTRCHFISNASGSYMTAKAFIGLSNTVCVYITDCSFMGAQSLIRGVDNVVNFSNVIIISRCNFERCTVGQIVNPWCNWSIRECTFEFTHVDIPAAITSDLASMPYFSSIDIDACYFWDPGSFTQVCIKQPAGVYWDIRIRNCWFHVFQAKHFEMLGPGVFICENNTFTSAMGTSVPTLIDLGSSVTAKKDVVKIRANYWPSSGDQSLVVLNYAGHGFVPSAVDIGGNATTGVWAKEPITGLVAFTGQTATRTFTLPDANDTIACLGTASVFSRQQNFGAATLTSSSSQVPWNLAIAQSAKHTMTEDTTLNNPTNMIDGGTYVLKITQHSTAPKTLAFGNAYKFPGGTPFVISAVNSAVDILTFVSDGSSMYCVGQNEFS